MSLPSPDLAPPLVLVVDDVEDTRLIYTAFLEYRGFRLSAARLLAGELATAHIPIILITGHFELVQPSTVKAAGARSLVLKPCLPEVLETELRRVLSGDQEFRIVRGTPRDL